MYIETSQEILSCAKIFVKLFKWIFSQWNEAHTFWNSFKILSSYQKKIVVKNCQFLANVHMFIYTSCLIYSWKNICKLGSVQGRTCASYRIDKTRPPPSPTPTQILLSTKKLFCLPIRMDSNGTLFIKLMNLFRV